MVKCAECGFLAVMLRGNANFPPRLEVADDQYRKDGNVLGGAALVWKRPYCVQREVEFSELLDPNPNTPDLVAVLEQERDCTGYYFWVPSFTAQEHLQMKLMERREAFENDVRSRREQFEQEVRREQREWQAQQEAAAQKRHDDQMAELQAEGDAAGGRHWRELLVFGGVIALATLFGSLIEAGWISNPWG